MRDAPEVRRAQDLCVRLLSVRSRSRTELRQAMARKEIWAHLLAYNLVRQVMSQAVQQHGVTPRPLCTSCRFLDLFVE